MQYFNRSVLALSAILAPGAGFAISASCGLEIATPYSLSLASQGITFNSEKVSPNQVRLENGRLFVEGREVALDDQDRATLKAMEQEVIGITAEAIVIASDAIDLAFDAIGEVSTALLPESANNTELLRGIEKSRALVQTQIRDAVLRHPLDEEAFEEIVAAQIATLAGDLVKIVMSDLVPKAITAALSGDETAIGDIEARASRIEAEIERKIEARAEAIEKRATALCPRVKALSDLESRLTVQLVNGSALNLLEN